MENVDQIEPPSSGEACEKPHMTPNLRGWATDRTLQIVSFDVKTTPFLHSDMYDPREFKIHQLNRWTNTLPTHWLLVSYLILPQATSTPPPEQVSFEILMSCTRWRLQVYEFCDIDRIMILKIEVDEQSLYFFPSARESTHNQDDVSVTKNIHTHTHTNECGQTPIVFKIFQYCVNS